MNEINTKTKEDISRLIASILSKPFEEVEAVVEGTFAVMQSLLVQGDRIEIRGFASLNHYLKPGQKYRDIDSKEMRSTPPRLGLKFKPSKKLEGDYQTYAPTTRRLNSAKSV